MAMTREQAAAAVAEASAERDSIQTNLLDLDGSFGRRMLAGATLTGESKLRWEAAADDLATLWEIFNTYAAVVAKAAADLDVRLATLGKLECAGRWARLAAELDTIETEAVAATERHRDAERAAAL